MIEVLKREASPGCDSCIREVVEEECKLDTAAHYPARALVLSQVSGYGHFGEVANTLVHLPVV